MPKGHILPEVNKPRGPGSTDGRAQPTPTIAPGINSQNDPSQEPDGGGGGLPLDWGKYLKGIFSLLGGGGGNGELVVLPAREEPEPKQPGPLDTLLMRYFMEQGQ